MNINQSKLLTAMYSDKSQISSRRRALSSISICYNHKETCNIKKTHSTSSVTSLFNADELEWDKDQDFSTFWESESMSSYDINERMAELIKQNFLDFDFNSKEASTCSVNTNSYSKEKRLSLPSPFLFSPINSLRLVDLFDTKLFDDKISASLSKKDKSAGSSINNLLCHKKIKESMKSSLSKNKLHRSMPILSKINSSEQLCINLFNKSKHLSYHDLLAHSDISIGMLNSKKINKRDELRLYLQASDEMKQARVLKPTRKVSTSGSSVNFSRLGRLTKLKYYMNDISDRIKGMIINAFISSKSNTNSKNSFASSNSNYLYSICEDTVDTYDIIEIDDILETPSVLQRGFNPLLTHKTNSLVKYYAEEDKSLANSDLYQNKATHIKHVEHLKEYET